MKLLMVLFVLTLALVGNYNANNLGNGWYGNLPPATEADLRPILDCMVANGAPARFELFAENVPFHLDGKPGLGPTQIRWHSKDGYFTDTDATVTRYLPQAAFTDLARILGGFSDKRIDCGKTKAVIVIKPNPLGDPWPEICAHCFRSNDKDTFMIHETFELDGKRYRREQIGSFFSKKTFWRQLI